MGIHKQKNKNLFYYRQSNILWLWILKSKVSEILIMLFHLVTTIWCEDEGKLQSLIHSGYANFYPE